MLFEAASGPGFARECQTWNSSVPDCASHSSVGRLLHNRYSCCSSLLPGEHGDRLDERRPLLLPVLLEEALAADAVGHADHRQRTIGEMRQHVRRDLREVAQQIALGERRLLQRRIGGPVDAIEMRERDAVRSHRERERGLRACELRDDVVDRAAARNDRRRRGSGFGAPHRLRIDVVAQPQEDRCAQVPSSVQLWKLTSATVSGSTHVVGALSSGFSANGQVLRCSGSRRALTCFSVRSSKPEPTCDA